MTQYRGLTYVRHGTFSGSAVSLRRALADRIDICDIDLLPLGRKPALVLSRIRSLMEAAREGPEVPWTKTKSWSATLQRELEHKGSLDSEKPLLAIQTLAALDIPDVRYAIYTDRVALEGSQVGGRFASKFSREWLGREIRFLRGAKHVFVMGPSTRAVLVDDYGLDPSRVVVVGAGPNCYLGSQRISDRCRRLLFVGTQWELKGGPDLLAAFGRINKHHPELKLLLVGSQPSHALPEGVTALGRVPHDKMDSIYSRADAVVIPAHMEAFGISLVEALIKGLPCIGTTIGNQPWIIRDAGRCVESGNVTAIENAIIELLGDYASFASRARTRGSMLSRTMTWERVAGRILDDSASWMNS